MIEEQSIAISPLDHKLAALLFDRVVPLHSSGTVPASIRFDVAVNMPDIEPLITSAKRLVKHDTSAPHDLDERATYTLNTVHNITATRLQQSLRASGVPAVAIYHSRSAYRESQTLGNNSAVEVVLAGIPLIDTEALTWEQIVQIREDIEFRKKLRRLRLFLNDNYEGKSAAYIRDSLLLKIETYEEDCRRHGLILVTSSLTQLVESKSLLGTLGVAASAILSGNTIIAGAAMTVGCALEVGKLALTVAEKRIGFKASYGEISYLIEVKSLASKGREQR